jgi:hypothetical protein
MDMEKTNPIDLPGRYGRAIKDLQRLLIAADAVAVVAGGWAVWRHGYAGRVTEDVDIVVAADRLNRLAELASAFGFEAFDPPIGRWPKMVHQSTGIDVDILPEAGIPGTPGRPAPVPIRHPGDYYPTPSIAGTLPFITLPGLIELKLGAGRAKDIADIVELIKQHRSDLETIQNHLASIHPTYVTRFQDLVQEAQQESGH